MVDVQAGPTAKSAPSEPRRPRRVLRGGKGVASQCVALVSTVLNFAVARGLRPDNPARGVKKPPTRKVERFLSSDEITSLATAIEAETQRTGNLYPGAAVKLLLLTGARRNEIMQLQWRHVDFERHCLGCPIAKPAPRSSFSAACIEHSGQPAASIRQSFRYSWHACWLRPDRHRQSLVSDPKDCWLVRCAPARPEALVCLNRRRWWPQPAGDRGVARPQARRHHGAICSLGNRPPAHRQRSCRQENCRSDGDHGRRCRSYRKCHCRLRPGAAEADPRSATTNGATHYKNSISYSVRLSRDFQPASTPL
jgi:hypothetical protein